MSLLLNTQPKNATSFYNGVTSNSLRANIADSPGLRRTTLAGTSVRKFTFSAWVKRAGTLAATENLFQQTGDSEVTFGFRASGDGGGVQFVHYTGSTYNWRLETSAKLRDSTAWYHLVARVDTTQGTNTNRVRIYINGVVQTDLAQNTYPGQNFDTEIGEADLRMYLAGGKGDEGGGNVYNDSYITEINFIDGQSLAPTSFGVFKEGIWIPKDTAGITFGNNGTRLQFKNSGTALTSEATTATTNIGDDSSGNGHNFAVLAYVASDVVLDNPENNFCTLNKNILAVGDAPVLTQGNLLSTQSGLGSSYALGTIPFRSGKWWMEVRVVGFNDNFAPLVIREDNSQSSDGSNTDIFSIGGSVGIYQNGAALVDGSTIGDGTFAPDGHDGNDVGDVIGVAVDLDSGTPNVKFFLDGTQTSIVQALPASMDIGNADIIFGALQYNGNTLHFNWGQDSTFGGAETATTNADENGIGAFHHAPPSGYLALCTANLPEPTIGPNSGAGAQATDHFNTVIYTGDASNNRNITGYGFQVDWIWVKERNSTSDHRLHDSARGAGKVVRSSSTDAELVRDEIDSFISDGFHISGSSDGIGAVNQSTSQTYVAWGWKANAGTATATISEGGDNPAAVVQANPTAGFSLITYTGTGDAGTIAHGLGAVPQMMIIKNRDEADAWAVYHGANTAAPATDYLVLNTTAGTADAATYWADTSPTSSVFTVHDAHNVNADGEKYVAYVFAEIEGYSKFGAYTGNGVDVNGAFVYLGFRPAWIMTKVTSAANQWNIHDNKRNPDNSVNKFLLADQGVVENTGTGIKIDFMANGFRHADNGAAHNNAGVTYIYMAFAEQPFKYANAR